ncbi:MAG TPA: peptide chain release factor 1 [Planctomycetes bacterium]|nr:peptide chain release factor 1 [Planctomycetota bacterium]|tara:strand:- start:416 stop:1507 length:1092 start_codon:yes stop_codon:yes gene_type:complete
MTIEVPEALLRKLGELAEQFEQLNTAIQDPELFNNPDAARVKLKEHGRLKPMVEGYQAWLELQSRLEEARALLEDEDEELRQLAEMELPELEEQREKSAQELRELFVSQDEESECDVIVEITAGVGGDESALFAGDLFRMYTRYAEQRRWKCELIDSNPGKVGGFKSVQFTVEGDGVYRRLRFESGGHRVQRVPETETQGRIHTSMVTVVVLPQAEEVDVEIDPGDVRVDTYRASGAGGQHVNKTESAIRLTHEPSGIVVQCQDEKSQTKNKVSAWKVLRARYADFLREQAEAERGAQRRSLRGRGNRNERIRTYNFPQDRCTDHRIGVSIHGLPQILDGAGQLDDLLDQLIQHDKEEALRSL